MTTEKAFLWWHFRDSCLEKWWQRLCGNSWDSDSVAGLNCRQSAPNPQNAEVILLQFAVLNALHSLCPAGKECLFFVFLLFHFPPQIPTYPTEPSVTQWNSPCQRARLFKAPGLLHKHRLLVLFWLTVQVSQQVLLNKLSDKAWLCFTVFKFLGELFRWWKCSSACICVKLQNYKTQPLVSQGLRWLKYQKDLHIEVFYSVSQYGHRYIV